MVSNHFKPESCGGATGANAEPYPGGGCFGADRVRQAQALAGFAGDLSAAGEAVPVLGDLDNHTSEDPVDVLTGAGPVDRLAPLDDADRYSYVFDGEQGVLDHAFSTLAPR